jgi:hypothetical protein
MGPTIVTYLTYSDLAGGPRPTIEEFRTELTKFGCGPVVYACSVINAVLRDWEGRVDSSAHDSLIKDSFPPDLANPILAALHNPNRNRGLYHRQQLLFVTKEAFRICPHSGGRDPVALQYWGGLGLVLLMANDLLTKGLTTSAPTAQQMLNVLAEFVPIAEASGFQRSINKIVRSYLMLNFFPGGSDEIRKVFLDATGIPLDHYRALCFATLVRYCDFKLDKYKSDMGHFLLTKDWYRTISLPAETIDRFLGGISAAADEFHTMVTVKNSGSNDFTSIKDKPLFRDGELFFMIDSAFLTDKEETGTFWRIHNALPRNARLQFHRDWGTAFEHYINWLLGQSIDSNLNKIFPNPRFADNGEEVCDSIILCQGSALFIESKGTTFTAEAKYGNDPAKLRSEIEEKFIQTTEQKKGVSQLAARIEDAFNRKHPRAIDGIDISGISKVFPVLITRDDIGAALVMNAYLAAKFRDIFRRKTVRVTVTPLFSLSSQDVEMICGYLTEVSFSDLLEERYRKDPKLLSTFWVLDNEIIDRIGYRECKAFAGAFESHSRSVEATLALTEPASGIGG